MGRMAEEAAKIAQQRSEAQREIEFALRADDVIAREADHLWEAFLGTVKAGVKEFSDNLPFPSALECVMIHAHNLVVRRQIHPTARTELLYRPESFHIQAFSRGALSAFAEEQTDTKIFRFKCDRQLQPWLVGLDGSLLHPTDAAEEALGWLVEFFREAFV